MGSKLDQRIIQVLRQGALDLHGITMALWPCLENEPRETALTAINYLRARVAVLLAQGLVISIDGRFSPNPGRCRRSRSHRRASGVARRHRVVAARPL